MRGGVGVSGEDTPLTNPGAASGVRGGGGVLRDSSSLVQFLVMTGGVTGMSELSLFSFKRLFGRLIVLGSVVIGRRVGGSRGASSRGGGWANPEGSSVGGGVDLESSDEGKHRRYLI